MNEAIPTGDSNEKGLVVFCVPTLTKPWDPFIESLEQEVPLIEAAGWRHALTSETGCPYISAARNMMLRRALDAKADVIVFLDDDVAWRPGDLLKLIEAKGDVVAGTYRMRQDKVRYMATVESWPEGHPRAGTPVTREDGCVKAEFVPAGFLKITAGAVNAFMVAYPELLFGPMYHLSVDLFNHGAHQRLWYGEDYAFSRRWRALGRDLWIVPDVGINHRGYVGNFHEFLLSQPQPLEEVA